MIIKTVSEFRKDTKKILDQAKEQPVFINRNGELFKLRFESTLMEAFDKSYGEPLPPQTTPSGDLWRYKTGQYKSAGEPTVEPLEDVA